jgi:hypothetical protein
LSIGELKIGGVVVIWLIATWGIVIWPIYAWQTVAASTMNKNPNLSKNFKCRFEKSIAHLKLKIILECE